MRTRNARKGFTIIEILVVMTLIGLMMAIMIPRFRVTPASHARSAARLAQKDAEWMRNRALSTKRLARMQFTSADNSYIGYGDDDADGTISANATESAYIRLSQKMLGNNVIYSRGNATAGIPGEVGTGAVTFTNARIEFDSRGIPTPFGTKGTVYFSTVADPTHVYALQMSAAGSFRVWTYINGTWQ